MQMSSRSFKLRTLMHANLHRTLTEDLHSAELGSLTRSCSHNTENEDGNFPPQTAANYKERSAVLRCVHDVKTQQNQQVLRQTWTAVTQGSSTTFPEKAENGNRQYSHNFTEVGLNTRLYNSVTDFRARFPLTSMTRKSSGIN
jgi:hypothetical protein